MLCTSNIQRYSFTDSSTSLLDHQMRSNIYQKLSFFLSFFVFICLTVLSSLQIEICYTYCVFEFELREEILFFSLNRFFLRCC